MFVLLQSIASLTLPPVKNLVRAALDFDIGTGTGPAQSKVLPRGPVLKAVSVEGPARMDRPADARVGAGILGLSLL
jgi:hypothetical protein